MIATKTTENWQQFKITFFDSRAGTGFCFKLASPNMVREVKDLSHQNFKQIVWCVWQ